MPINLQVGKSYKTRGGWRARVIYVGDGITGLFVGRDSFSDVPLKAIAVHDNPNPPDQKYGKEIIAFHDEIGRASTIHRVSTEPPTFGDFQLHPADLVEEI